jgi:hypothetical protein
MLVDQIVTPDRSPGRTRGLLMLLLLHLVRRYLGKTNVRPAKARDTENVPNIGSRSWAKPIGCGRTSERLV